jgi:hypothetical protein
MPVASFSQMMVSSLVGSFITYTFCDTTMVLIAIESQSLCATLFLSFSGFCAANILALMGVGHTSWTRGVNQPPPVDNDILSPWKHTVFLTCGVSCHTTLGACWKLNVVLLVRFCSSFHFFAGTY